MKTDEEYREELIRFHEKNPSGISRSILKPVWNDLYSWVLEKTKFLDEHFSSVKFRSRYFCIKHRIEKFPRCIECGNEIFSDFKYSTTVPSFCSNRCASKNERTQQKIKATKLTIYGSETFANISKAKQTKKERYGNENYVNAEKAKQTKFERYGDSNYNNRNKAKETIQHSIDIDPFYFEKKAEKYAMTSKRKYGVLHPGKSDIVKAKRKATCLEKYGVENFVESDVFKAKADITIANKTNEEKVASLNKAKETRLNKYGDENYNNRQKMKSTKLRLYGNENYTNSVKAKQTCLERYKVDSYFKTDEFKLMFNDEEFVKNINRKKYLTHKKNNSFKASKGEDICYDLLKEKFPNTIRQYNSEKYPFNCDFYIPEKDLYIEFNGTWTHGRHAFDPTNEDDLNLVKAWEEKGTAFYKGAIDNWTRRDVLKRETAKKNGLNFLEFWNLNEVKEWLNTQSVNI